MIKKGGTSVNSHDLRAAIEQLGRIMPSGTPDIENPEPCHFSSQLQWRRLIRTGDGMIATVERNRVQRSIGNRRQYENAEIFGLKFSLTHPQFVIHFHVKYPLL